MGYVYNDASMMMATQIAYLNLDGKGNQAVGPVVKSILKSSAEPDGKGGYKVKDGVTGLAKKQAEVAINIQQLGDSNKGVAGWEKWKVVDICNDEHNTGYYGMVIDTGNKNAIIGCRGSESYNTEQLVKDWGAADVGLLDNKLTAQQKMAQKYMEQIYYKYGKDYDTFSVSGHSLGGNLAEHMTVTAPAGMRAKIDHTISFDGPGFSQEYIDAHKDAIAKTSGLMDHYQWSWVSSLLISLPGVKDRIIKAHNEDYGTDIASRFVRHDTHNVEYDEDGNALDGTDIGMPGTLGDISRNLEHFGEGGPLEFLKVMTQGQGPLSWVTRGFYIFKLARKIAPTIAAKWNDITKSMSDLYYRFIAPSVSEKYSVKPQNILASGEELEKAIGKLNNVAEEIADIRRNLKYWSDAGGYYRSCLIMLKIGIERDIKHLKSMHKVLDPIVKRYEQADIKVQNQFATIQNGA